MLSSLNEAQRKQAILDFQMRDLVLGPGRDGQTIQPEGVKASALTEKQRQMLLDLAERMDRHPARSRGESENGRDEKEHRRNLVCVERPN